MVMFRRRNCDKNLNFFQDGKPILKNPKYALNFQVTRVPVFIILFLKEPLMIMFVIVSSLQCSTQN